MKLRRYSYGNRSIDTLLNKIEKTFGSSVLIGYGNWSRSTQMKHTMPTMGKGLRKLTHKRYGTLTINEHNASQKRCECYNDLKRCYDKKGKKIYRLFHCPNCVSSKNKNAAFRTRDKSEMSDILRNELCYLYNEACKGLDKRPSPKPDQVSFNENPRQSPESASLQQG